MQSKTYYFILIVIILALGAALVYGTNTGNYLIAIFALPAAIIILLILKPLVRGVTEDERHFLLAGHASRWAFSVFIVTAAIASNVLLALGNRLANADKGSAELAREMTISGVTLSLAMTFIFLVYIIAYFVYSRKS